MASEIEKIGEWKDSKWFNTTCDCGPGHHMQFWIDKEFNDIELHFESKVGYWEKLYCYDWKKFEYWKERLWKLPKERIRRAFNLLFFGYIEHEESFLFRSDAHVEEFVKTIVDARNEFIADKENGKWYFGTLKKTGPKEATYKDNVKVVRNYLKAQKGIDWTLQTK